MSKNHDDMLGALMRVLVTLPPPQLGRFTDLARKLAGLSEARWAKYELELNRFLREEPCWVQSKSILPEGDASQVCPAKTPVQVLEYVSTFTIPAQPTFHVGEKFNKDNSEVQFYHIDEDFHSGFGTMTEKEIGETKVIINRLLIPAHFSEMTPELGENRILTCSQLYSMLLQQPKREKLKSKNLTCTSFLRVLDKKGIERVVYVYDDKDGWVIDTYDLTYVCRWNAGTQALSRKELRGIWVP